MTAVLIAVVSGLIVLLVWNALKKIVGRAFRLRKVQRAKVVTCCEQYIGYLREKQRKWRRLFQYSEGRKGDIKFDYDDEENYVNSKTREWLEQRLLKVKDYTTIKWIKKELERLRKKGYFAKRKHNE